MTAGVAMRLGIGYEDCKRVKPDVVYCNTWAYGLEGPLAHFGGLDPLYQASAGLEYEAGPGARGQRAALLPLRHDRHGQRDAVGRRLPRRAVPPARARGEGQELWTSLLDGGAMFVVRRAARRRRGGAAARGSTRTRPASTRATACTRRRTAGSRSRRSKTRTGQRACARRSGVPELADDARFATRAARAEHRRQLEALLEPRFATQTAIHVVARCSTTPACPTRSRSTPRPASACSSTPTTSGSASSPSTTTRSLGRMRQFGIAHRLLRDARPHRTARRRSSASTRVEILEWLGYARPTRRRCKAEGVVYWPDDDYAWTV